MLSIIVAVANNNVIGKDNKLIWHLPEDLKRFKTLTTGHNIIMGRKTFESLPGAQPLAKRTNIVLTTKTNYHPKNVIVAHNSKEAEELLKKYRSEDIYIIGGQSVYEQFLPFVNTIHVTKINYTYQADTFFPDLTQMKEWVMKEESEEQTYFDLEYYFQKYVRKS